jgi:hypothetical protein
MFAAFKDPSFQKEFDQKGYVLVPSLLNSEQIDTLNSVFQKFRTRYEGPFHTSHFSRDISYKQQVHDAIAATVFPSAASYLNDFRPVFGNFMIKNADHDFAMPLHSDWTYVNEPEFSSAAVWIPLVDVSAENGCLGIIEGSHKVTDRIRGPEIQESARKDDKDWAKRYGKLLPMKAGDAIIYNHALLHYSPPNKSSSIRPAVNLSLAPANAPLIHYCIPEGSKEIEMYQVTDSNFFIHYNHFQRPETGTLVKTMPADSVKWIDTRMNTLWKTRLLDRIKRWVN